MAPGAQTGTRERQVPVISVNMDIKLPKLGEGAESGVVVAILVKPGDSIQEGQTMIELESDKAVAPVPANASGTVAELRVKEGDRISAGQVILTLVGASDATTSPPPTPKTAKASRLKAAAPAPSAEQQEQPAALPEPAAAEATSEAGSAPLPPPGIPVAAAPSLRRLARELGLDLTKIRGSEAGGRIVLADLRAYIQRLERLATPPKPAAPAGSAGFPTSAAAPAVLESIDFSKWGPVTRKPLAPLRQTIGRRMLENWNAIPHVTQFDEADMAVINELRKTHAAVFEARGTKLTMTPFILKAVVAALKKHPLFNASLDEAAQELVFKDYFHLGVAVDTEQGLIVPVVRDVDKKSLSQLAQEVNALAEKARARKLTLEEMRGGTFTISNQGAFGGAHFTPIVNKPEVAILGLGRAAQRPTVRDGQVVARPLVPLALSYDHRIIDGGSAARFMVDLVAAFETFPVTEIA